MELFSRTDTSLLGRWWWTVDRVLLALILGVIAFGLVLVPAASPPVAERIGVGEFHFIIRHMVYLVPTLILLFGLSLCSLHWIWRIATLVFGGSILAMILVLGFGNEVKGATRWLPVLGFSLQPSEFMKPSFIVVIAWLIARQKEVPTFRGKSWATALYALALLLLVMQPDFGMSVVTTGCFLGVLFLGGLQFRYVVSALALGIGGAVTAYFSLSHVRSRVDRFLNPDSGDTFQIDRSLEAFKNGGLFGTGAGQGTVKLGIPDAHADFIFSVSGEELGLLITLVLVTLFAMIVVRGLSRVMDSDNVFTVLATGGLLILFGGQTLIHMGSSLSLLPTKGMTLPFISYGGSSMIAMGMAMGFVLALTRRQARSSIARGSLSLRPV